MDVFIMKCFTLMERSLPHVSEIALDIWNCSIPHSELCLVQFQFICGSIAFISAHPGLLM